MGSFIGIRVAATLRANGRGRPSLFGRGAHSGALPAGYPQL